MHNRTYVLLAIQGLMLFMLSLVIRRSSNPAFELYAARGLVRVQPRVFRIANLFGANLPEWAAVPTIVAPPLFSFEWSCDRLFYDANTTCYLPQQDEVPPTSLHILQALAPNAIYTAEITYVPTSDPQCMRFAPRASFFDNLTQTCSTASVSRSYIVPPPLDAVAYITYNSTLVALASDGSSVKTPFHCDGAFPIAASSTFVATCCSDGSVLVFDTNFTVPLHRYKHGESLVEHG